MKNPYEALELAHSMLVHIQNGGSYSTKTYMENMAAIKDSLRADAAREVGRLMVQDLTIKADERRARIKLLVDCYGDEALNDLTHYGRQSYEALMAGKTAPRRSAGAISDKEVFG